MLDKGFYNMDCMEALREFPDGFFELAVVDPPYGGVTQGGYMTNNVSGGVARHRNYHLALWSQKKPAAEYFRELKRVSRNQVIWGGELLHDADRRRFAVLACVGQGNASGRTLCRCGARVDIVRSGSQDFPLPVEWYASGRYEEQRAQDPPDTEARSTLQMDLEQLRQRGRQDTGYSRRERVVTDRVL